MTAVFLFTVLYGRDFGNAVFESVKKHIRERSDGRAASRESGCRGGGREQKRDALEDAVFAAASHDLRQPCGDRITYRC